MRARSRESTSGWRSVRGRAADPAESTGSGGGTRVRGRPWQGGGWLDPQEIEEGEEEEDEAKDSHEVGEPEHEVEAGGLGLEKVLVEGGTHRTGVADCIGEIDRKDRGACEMGVGNGAVKEDAPVGDVGEVGPEAGKDHPGLPSDLSGLEEEGREHHEGEASEHDDIGPDQAETVVANEVEDHQGGHDPECDGSFSPVEGSGVRDLQIGKQLRLEVVPEVAVGGEEEIGEAEQDHAGEEGPEEFPSFAASHGVAFRAQADVVLGGWWKPGEEEDGEEKGQEENRPGGEGHPEFGHLGDFHQPRPDAYLALHQPRPHAFHYAAGEDVGAGETCEQKLGGVATLQVAHHHAPDHAEGQAIAEDGQDLEIGGKDRKEQQGGPRHQDEEDEVEPQPPAMGLGTEFHAEVLGGGVADKLGDHEDGLGLKELAEKADGHLGILVGGSRERLAEGVHAEVGREGGHDGIEGEDQIRGPVEVAGERGAEVPVHEPLR